MTVTANPDVAITTTELNAVETPGGRRKIVVASLAVAAVAILGVFAFSVLGGSDDEAVIEPAVVRPQAPVADPLDDAAGNELADDAVAELPAAELPPAEASAAEQVSPDGAVSDEATNDSASDAVDQIDSSPVAGAGTADDAAASPNEAPAEPDSDPDDQAQPAGDAQENADAPVAGGEAASAEQADQAAEQDVPAGTATPADPAGPAGEVVESMGVVRNGQIFLEGAVPSAEAGEQIEALAAEVLGPDNVFNNYVIDPRASDPNLGNLTVEDTINFAANSAVILSEGEGLLNQGLALLTIRPGMTITIVGHTDARGPTGENQWLSEQRAQAVKQWFVDNGVDPDRLVAQGAGESEPIADNQTSDGQRLNRRIQFFLENILG